MTPPPEFPKLNVGEYAVVRAERATGIVLNRRCGWAVPGDDRFFVFGSLEEALSFVQAALDKDASLECLMFNHSGASEGVFRRASS